MKGESVLNRKFRAAGRVSRTPAWRHFARAALAALLPAVLAAPARHVEAQSWPQHKPIRLIVPFATGGPIDIMARITSPLLAAALGQVVVVDNRAGAGGVLGVDLLAKSPADGYTLGFSAPGALTIAPHLSKIPYSPATDIAYVSMIGQVQNILVVNGKLGISSLADLIRAAKQKPGSINFASSGIGTGGHLAGELLKQLASVDIVHVPYKSGAAPLTDLVAGNVQVLFVAAGGSLRQLVNSGALTALVLTSPTRSELLPNIPSAVEAGMPGLITADIYGMVAPAKLPAEMLARLNAEAVTILRKRELIDKFAEQTLVATPSTPQEYRAWMQTESARWGEVIKRAQIRPE